MITHRVHEFMDDLRRTWCGINLEFDDPRPADNTIVDCMSCLVVEAHLSTSLENDGAINSDSTVTITPLVRGVIPWP